MNLKKVTFSKKIIKILLESTNLFKEILICSPTKNGLFSVIEKFLLEQKLKNLFFVQGAAEILRRF